MFQQISKDDFLQQYWQQAPLVLRQAFCDLIDVIDGDDLAGLACEEIVESRIISGLELDQPWHCQPGPFTQEYFAQVADKNWTLLVQGVDQWIEEIQTVLERFSFLPRWRLEDIMISYAPTGGGVGPHFDYYDVFLIQVSGQRQWQIGALCDEHTPLQDNAQVKLLSDFDAQQTHTLAAGDAIYIPAGFAHWGTALSDECITLSVGFRAPSEKEIVAEALEIVVQKLSENIRYKDTIASIDHHPHKINQAAKQQLSTVLQTLTPPLIQRSMEEAFGRLVTDSRYTHYDNEQVTWNVTQIKEIFEKNYPVTLAHFPHCRMAYSSTQLFVNGEAFASDEGFAQALCNQVIQGPLTNEQLQILVELLNQGLIHFVA